MRLCAIYWVPDKTEKDILFSLVNFILIIHGSSYKVSSRKDTGEEERLRSKWTNSFFIAAMVTQAHLGIFHLVQLELLWQEPHFTYTVHIK